MPRPSCDPRQALLMGACISLSASSVVEGSRCSSTHNAVSTPFRLLPDTMMRAMLARAWHHARSTAITRLLETAKVAGTVVGGIDAAILSERERETVTVFIRDVTTLDISFHRTDLTRAARTRQQLRVNGTTAPLPERNDAVA